MKSIETIATVTKDGKITVQLPPDIPAGVSFNNFFSSQ
ncbi:hypothetical protein NSP_37280 [Nodularia spumigena CCY9414]|jgi:hypothetical protein|nr:hypothetical protein NSP_37280 [Nodularia spumigena CCY9414]EAW46357.1 hypothetical protein N9414_11634 [Nodularia spumigena CCY9414]